MAMRCRRSRMRFAALILGFVLLLLVYPRLGRVLAISEAEEHQVRETATRRQLLLDKAIQFAQQERVDYNDLSVLYKIAKQWKSDGDTDCWKLYQYLADHHEHVPSMAMMGHYFAELNDTERALAYFQQAGEMGPHHASLYNAGRLMAEQADHYYPLALAYFVAGATLHVTHPQHASKDLTELSMQAHDLLSKQIASMEFLPIEVMADCFLYGNVKDHSSTEPASTAVIQEEVEQKWTAAVLAVRQFNQTFVNSAGQQQDAHAMEEAATALRWIWEHAASLLSPLQAYLLLDTMNDALGLLTGLQEEYVAMAAGYAEALAISDLCWNQYAIHEQDPACFNGAAASAMSYYRRIGDTEASERILKLGNVHPHASTKWSTTKQTPRVFHPELTSKPWWDTKDFVVVNTLEQLYKKQKKKILREVERVKSLQEGRLRASVEVDVNGEPVATAESDVGGMQRIFTPYIGVRTEDGATATEGAGGWSEFGPLFNGRTWNAERCKVLPTICEALQSNIAAMDSLCSSPSSTESQGSVVVTNSTHVWERCGSDTVITMLRLRPGTTILPHCGTSNARLIMHFPLIGSKGIDFTVGEVTVKNYGKGDGNAIVFDDSFEHYVHHGGKDDRYVILAVLRHPDR